MRGIPLEILRYCRYQPRTEEEVRKKLIALRYPPDAIETILSVLKGKSLLDDLRYAEAYISIHLNRGWGRKKILQALRHKGIVIEATKWNQWVDPETYAQALRKALSQCLHQSQEKKIRFLLGRGFALSEIQAFLARQRDDP